MDKIAAVGLPLQAAKSPPKAFKIPVHVLLPFIVVVGLLQDLDLLIGDGFGIQIDGGNTVLIFLRDGKFVGDRNNGFSRTARIEDECPRGFRR